jgi:hypothetical protein
MRSRQVLAIAVTLLALFGCGEQEPKEPGRGEGATSGEQGAGNAPMTPEQRIQASRMAIKHFAELLKGELEDGMKAGGPPEAIAVCQKRAPAIAAEISAEKGMRLGRTSLKTRNPDNAPDAWERVVLEDFEARKKAGDDLASLERHEIVVKDGRREFRFMKAIPTNQLCLQCHGETIPPDVREKLDALYPDDRARGFAFGDIRGAFTVRQSL